MVLNRSEIAVKSQRKRKLGVREARTSRKSLKMEKGGQLTVDKKSSALRSAGPISSHRKRTTKLGVITNKTSSKDVTNQDSQTSTGLFKRRKRSSSDETEKKTKIRR